MLHITLKNWADVILIAPLDACTLSKIANGMSDNLLTCVVRAIRLYETKLVLCPAMNTSMWENPFTKIHLDQISQLYKSSTVLPLIKKLACGDIGMGALASPSEILSCLHTAIELKT